MRLLTNMIILASHSLKMKPDIVAPKHFVLAARANPNVAGECDGASNLSVKRSSTGRNRFRYTMDMPMVPVLRGRILLPS